MTPDISKAKFGYKQLACVRELGRGAAAGQGREERGRPGSWREDPAQEVGPGPVLTVGWGSKPGGVSRGHRPRLHAAQTGVCQALCSGALFLILVWKLSLPT